MMTNRVGDKTDPRKEGIVLTYLDSNDTDTLGQVATRWV